MTWVTWVRKKIGVIWPILPQWPSRAFFLHFEITLNLQAGNNCLLKMVDSILSPVAPAAPAQLVIHQQCFLPQAQQPSPRLFLKKKVVPFQILHKSSPGMGVGGAPWQLSNITSQELTLRFEGCKNFLAMPTRHVKAGRTWSFCTSLGIFRITPRFL